MGSAVVVAVDPRNLLLAEQHGDWYQTLATVTGALVALAGVAITLVLTVAPNDRLERVLREVGPNLGRLVMNCIGGLVLTTTGFAGMFLLETGAHRTRVAVTAALVAFTLLRFGRLWRLFLAVITVLTTPAPRTTLSDGAERWERPTVAPDQYVLGRRRVRRSRTRG
jgi:hypothetical protein